MFKRFILAISIACACATTSFAGYGFSLPSFSGGGTVSFPSGQIVIVDFWASWCAPCKASFAAYNTLKSKYPQIKIIGINQDKDKAEGKKFLASTPANFTLAWDEGGKVFSQYGVGNMPTAYLFDKSGNLHKTFAGFNSGSMKEMEEAIKEISK